MSTMPPKTFIDTQESQWPSYKLPSTRHTFKGQHYITTRDLFR